MDADRPAVGRAVLLARRAHGADQLVYRGITIGVVDDLPTLAVGLVEHRESLLLT